MSYTWTYLAQKGSVWVTYTAGHGFTELPDVASGSALTFQNFIDPRGDEQMHVKWSSPEVSFRPEQNLRHPVLHREAGSHGAAAV